MLEPKRDIFSIIGSDPQLSEVVFGFSQAADRLKRVEWMQRIKKFFGSFPISLETMNETVIRMTPLDPPRVMGPVLPTDGGKPEFWFSRWVDVSKGNFPFTTTVYVRKPEWGQVSSEVVFREVLTGNAGSFAGPISVERGFEYSHRRYMDGSVNHEENFIRYLSREEVLSEVRYDPHKVKSIHLNLSKIEKAIRLTEKPSRVNLEVHEQIEGVDIGFVLGSLSGYTGDMVVDLEAEAARYNRELVVRVLPTTKGFRFDSNRVGLVPVYSGNKEGKVKSNVAYINNHSVSMDQDADNIGVVVAKLENIDAHLLTMQVPVSIRADRMRVAVATASLGSWRDVPGIIPAQFSMPSIEGKK